MKRMKAIKKNAVHKHRDPKLHKDYHSTPDIKAALKGNGKGVKHNDSPSKIPTKNRKSHSHDDFDLLRLNVKNGRSSWAFAPKFISKLLDGQTDR